MYNLSLPEEEKDRVYETELIRARARADVQEEMIAKNKERSDERASVLFGDGLPAGSCPNCECPSRSRWKFCPFCSYPVHACMWCHERLPAEEGIKFCPHCGKGNS